MGLISWRGNSEPVVCQSIKLTGVSTLLLRPTTGFNIARSRGFKLPVLIDGIYIYKSSPKTTLTILDGEGLKSLCINLDCCNSGGMFS